MQIGIIGCGMVGGTLAYGFNRIGHDLCKYDPFKYPNSRIQDVLEAEVTFICVPTPMDAEGACDTSLVEQTVRALADCNYRGLACIKSTVTPGTTDRLDRRYLGLRLAFCPEFLREKATLYDFVDNQEICVLGTYEAADTVTLEQAHGSLAKHLVHMKPVEAELTKYFCNVYNALRIVYANEFFDVCQKAGANYQVIKAAVTKRASVGTYYLDCAKGFRGYGGNCLPKDISAFASYVRRLGLSTQLYDTVMQINERHL